MRHRKTPGWVMMLKRAPNAPIVPAPKLSDLIGTIELVCDPCGRRGRYRADRLLAELGDIYLPEVGEEIARRAGCYRALNPPTPASHDYGSGGCRIRFDRAAETRE